MIFRAIVTKLYKLQFSAYCNRIPYNIPYIEGFITYFSLGIGSCFGGLSLKCCKSRFITSETGLACSSLILSRNFLIESVVRNANNSDRFSFIRCLQCITYFVDIKLNYYYTMYNNMILLWQV